MGKFNSAEYLKDQVLKQYTNEVKTIHKNTLDFSPFNKALANFNEKQYHKIHRQVSSCSIMDIQESIKNDEFSYVELLLYYVKSIKSEDHGYNSVLFLNLEALAEAKNRIYSDDHHLIYGMPILVKGNIGVKGLPLTAGSAALKNNIAKRDSAIVKKLKDKGAIILGQANLSEFANYMTSDSSNGYSALGGQTKNPYGSFDVGGSSAGSAVAASKGFACAAIGTETAGSVIYPTSQNGIIGLKPTLGLVSQDMIVPISKTHDTAGPMTKNVKDQLILWDAISDSKIQTFDFKEKCLSKTKIGIIMNEEIIDTFRDADSYFLKKMKKKFITKGAIVETVTLDSKLFSFDISDVLSYEFNKEINKFLKKHFLEAKVNSLEKIIKKNNEDLKNMAPYGQDLLEESLNNNDCSDDIIGVIKDYRKRSSEIFDEAFKTYDFLLTISNYMTTPYACSGHPAINFPVGIRASGEPLGGTLIGPKNSEVALIEAVHAYLS